MTVRLVSHKMVAVKIITVLLSAFAFVLFAIGTMGYTYNYTDYVTRGYLNYVKEERCVIFSEGTNAKDPLRADEIERMATTVAIRFVYSDTSYLAVNTIYYVYDHMEDDRHVKDDVWKAISSGYSLTASAEEYEAFGFTVLAGKFPTEKNEIAIGEQQFRIFQQYGYCDATKNIVSNGYSFLYDNSLPDPEKVEINDYSDIIGKTLVYNYDGVQYTVVGVVDTCYDEAYEDNHYNIYNPYNRYLFSEQWREDRDVNYAFCPVITDYSTMKALVKLTFALKAEAEQAGRNTYMIALFLNNIFHADNIYDEALIAVICGGAGVFFGIFAVLLNGHLTTLSIERKQKKIGILRSLGANEKTVTKIFLLEALITATCIFLLALAGSLALYYGWLAKWLFIGRYEVCLLTYNGWTVLILAAFCYAVPLLCTIAPLKKFFKKPIVDNINEKAVITNKKR